MSRMLPRRRLLATAAAAVVVAGAAVWFVTRPPGAPSNLDPPDAEGPVASGSLAPAPLAAHPRTGVATADAGSGDAAASADAPEDDDVERKPLRIYAKLVGDDAAEIAISALDRPFDGGVVRDAPSPTIVIRAAPGEDVSLGTSDPRAAVECWLVHVPDPLPTALIAPILAKSDARLRTLRLEVIDAETGAQVPDAWLETGGLSRLSADVEGRFRLEPADGALWGAEPLKWLFNPTGWVGLGIEIGSIEIGSPRHLPWRATAVSAEQAAALVARGVLPVVLHRPPRAWRPVALRVVDAVGTAIGDAVLLVSAPLGAELALHTRSDAAGVARFVAPPSFAVEVRVLGWPVAKFVLSNAVDGVREVRLPPIAHARIHVPPDPLTWWIRGEFVAKPMVVDRDLLIGEALGAAESERALLTRFRSGTDLCGRFVPDGSEMIDVMLPIGTSLRLEVTRAHRVSRELVVVGSAPAGPPIEWESIPRDASSSGNPTEAK
jgi:hypothetical protein